MNQDESEGDEGARTEGESKLSRRELVASGAVTWATVGLAGCSYITDPGPEETEDEDTPTGNGTDGNTTVTNETTTTEGSGGGCASLGRFAAGMDIAMNVDIFDQGSGEHLGGEAIDGVRVEFPDADFDGLALDWSGPHDEFTNEQWGGKLSTTEAVDPGTYRYEIVVEGERVDGEERITDQFTIV